jgi:hypothetical protein
LEHGGHPQGREGVVVHLVRGLLNFFFNSSADGG